MQISALKKLLHLISPSESPSEKESSEEISDQNDDVNAECKMQNAEFTEDKEADEFEIDEIGAEEEISDKPDEPIQKEEPAQRESNRSHLTSSVPRAAKAPSGVMTKQELREIRELFGNLDDLEIQRLYKKVTKQN